jgi:hypothetical protein
MSEKALAMLKHMRKQMLGQRSRCVEVRGAAVSIGVDPGGSECDGLVDELLRDGHLQRYPAPSLTAHGLYRLTESGVSVADAAALAEARRKAQLNEGREHPTPNDTDRPERG